MLQPLEFGSIQAPSITDGLRNGHVFLKLNKVDAERRIVWGVAQIEERQPDLQGDIVDFDASIDAFSKWAGNAREMHENKAVGRALHVLADKDAKQILVGVYVSKGAEDTWQKVLDGTLRGFSIGGSVIRDKFETNKSTGKRIHRILEYSLDELSLVDSPANASCVFTAVVKRNGGLPSKIEFTRNGLHTAGSIARHRAIDLV